MIKVVHVRRSEYDVYIGRAVKELPASKWANPFVIGKHGTRAEVIAKYDEWVRTQPELMRALPELRGKTLGCWCKTGGVAVPCHGDVLKRLVEQLDQAPQPAALTESAKTEVAPGPVAPIRYRVDCPLPLFTSTYSYNQSILTFEEAGKTKPDHAASIVDMALAAQLKQVTVVDDRMDGVLDAQKSLSKAGLQLIYGLKLAVVPDLTVKDDAAEVNRSYVIIFMKDAMPSKGVSQSYTDLLKLNNRAWTTGRFNVGRLDWRSLKELWTPNLRLALPFFSSFISRNLLSMASIIPDLPCAPLLFKEVDSRIPYAALIEQAVDQYAANHQCAIQPVKSIYYRDSAAFEDYVLFRASSTRSKGKMGTMSAPNLDNLSSDQFSMEAWSKLAKEVS